MLTFRRGPAGPNGKPDPDMEKALADAIQKWADTKAPEDHADVLRLYESYSGYRAGCGACIAGRRLFIESLNSLLAGDTESAGAKMRGAFKSARFKFDILKGKLGL